MEKVKESCCACEADFKKSVDTLVRQEHCTTADHARKQAEVDAAFGAGHPHPGMSGTLAGTSAHHRMENTGAHYHEGHYHPDRPAISPEHHRLHHEPHHQHIDRKR